MNMETFPKVRSSHRSIAILIIWLLGLATVLIAFLILVPSNNDLSNANFSSSNATSEHFDSFNSYSDLLNFIATNAQSAQVYSRYGNFLVGGPVELGAVPEAAFATASTSQSSTSTYTGTNVQVAGVDEPDIVKTDGSHLFVATNNAVTIINAYPPNSTSIISTIDLPSSDVAVLGLEISQNRLLVIDQRNPNWTINYVDLLLYDTTNLSSPILIENNSVLGNYVAARLADGYFYAVIQQPSYQFLNNTNNATGTLPEMTKYGVTTILPPSSVYYAPNNMQISYYTMIVSINMSTGQEKVISVLTGPSSTIYVSTANIYVVYTNYPEFYADNIPGDVFTGGVISSSLPMIQAGGDNSTIFRASYSNGSVAVQAVGSIPGTVLNQFSMDEYEDYFRVATSGFVTVGNYTTTSDDVFVLNENMSQVAVLRNIAPGENLYAVRFVGDMGYVVTFEQVDPLFAISFQNITKPVILSALQVSGYSDYLQPLPNGYLIGVGKDTVASSTGNFSYYLGLKLSLFQVFSNGSSSEVSSYLIGDRGTDSPVLTDHLAFTFDSSNNIMVIPVLLAEVSGNQTYYPGSPPPYGNYVWQGAYIFKVNSTGFTLLGRVSQYPPNLNYSESSTNNLDIDRSVIIGNYLYTISSGEVMASDLSTFSTIATVPLPNQ